MMYKNDYLNSVYQLDELLHSVNKLNSTTNFTKFI